MVSKHLHCLNDLLFRHSTGSLQIEIPVVVSNHLDAEPLVRAHGLDFMHIPVTPETKPGAEDQLRELIEKHGIHLVVLARYMQVLSDDLCTELSGWPSTSTTRSCRASRARALPPGVRPRREAGRGDGALRDGRPRRGPDHRAGRHPRGPQLQPGAWSPPAGTWKRRCCRGRSGGTRSRGCCSTGIARSCSADPPLVDVRAQRGSKPRRCRPLRPSSTVAQ